jgi:hypothetical protein
MARRNKYILRMAGWSPPEGRVGFGGVSSSQLHLGRVPQASVDFLREVDKNVML